MELFFRLSTLMAVSGVINAVLYDVYVFTGDDGVDRIDLSLQLYGYVGSTQKETGVMELDETTSNPFEAGYCDHFIVEDPINVGDIYGMDLRVELGAVLGGSWKLSKVVVISREQDASYHFEINQTVGGFRSLWTEVVVFEEFYPDKQYLTKKVNGWEQDLYSYEKCKNHQN